ncbi:hypothetical protein [Sulfoacidibacillus thermotolerans]|uniref:Uncharacterized protein n=1 Tax=Sulfoacidibacillus thermotolerans TaxID=1765684 RepID=A0A2U3D6G3_SULT2|nr:hypothetical protein [Sulfoacidibacillus thermotolerans]PWI56859.1 hypothetical protein BM613_11510 [Sulfoacidibacillus thermotolerans]
MRDDQETTASEPLDPKIKAALLSAFAVEPSHDLAVRIVEAARCAQSKRRNRLALATMILSLIGIASPLIVLLVTPGRMLGYALWRIYMGLQGILLQSSLNGSSGSSLETAAVTSVLILLAIGLGMSATRLARTSR